jgi:hypothetical protein
MIEYTDDEIEQERKEEIAKYDDLDETRERYINEIGYSEVLHAAYMLTETVDHYLSENPAVVLDREAYHQARLASTHLFNLYQRIGALRHECSEIKTKTGVADDA